MRCSDLRALRQTTAGLSAAAFYSACAPVETVNGDGHGGTTGAAGAPLGRGGSSGSAGRVSTAGTTGAGAGGGTIGPGAAGTGGGAGTVGSAGQSGAAIHGVGAQSHAASNLSASTLQANIDKITAQTGLPVHISEYDLNIADDNQQKNGMQSQFTMFWNDRNVAGITIWGYVVGSTWETNSGLMNSNGTMRPAMTWLMGFLGR